MEPTFWLSGRRGYTGSTREGCTEEEAFTDKDFQEGTVPVVRTEVPVVRTEVQR